VLKMMAVSFSETLVPIFQTSQRLIAGAWNLQLAYSSTDAWRVVVVSFRIRDWKTLKYFV